MSNFNTWLISGIAKLPIRLIHNITKVLSSPFSNHKHTFEKHYIDLIFKLKSPSKVKPKDKATGVNNKKQFQTKTWLDNFTHYQLSIFEYKKRKKRAKTP